MFGDKRVLEGVHVIDGGLASEIEAQGGRIDGTLWSAEALEREPERVAAVHRAYIEAGAECVATCSYQVSRMGYREAGLTAEAADRALLASVRLARAVAEEFPQRRVRIAASLGPYGAALHNGGEYSGEYGCSHEDLVRFHRERIEVLAGAKAEAQPDLLAFETFPSLEEARAVGEALEPWPEIPVWFSFSCRDERHVAHGEPVAETAAAVSALPQTVAIGVNCVPARWLAELIGELRRGSPKPVLVYPNLGEGWDAERRCWVGTTDPGDFGRQAQEWFSAGVEIAGGCCRTRPEHIRAVADAAAARWKR